MAVLKKKRNYHTKSSRQSQLQLQQQHLQQLKDNEANRLKPQQISSMVHDESDTVSFRANLLKNFINSSDYLNILTNQPIPMSMIKPPRIYHSSSQHTLKTIVANLQTKVNGAIKILDALKERVIEFDRKEVIDQEKSKNEHSFVFDSLENTNAAIMDYITEHNLRMQDSRTIKHSGKFNHLKIDNTEAPADYWEETYKKLIDEEKQKEELKKKEEAQRKKEEEQRLAILKHEQAQKLLEDQRLEELEAQQKRAEQQSLQLQSKPEESKLLSINDRMIRQNEQLEPGQIPQPVQAAVRLPSSAQQISLNESNELNPSNATNGNDTNIPQDSSVEPGQQANLLEDMFTDYNDNTNEPFNNVFDDEFGDEFDNLDNVFF